MLVSLCNKEIHISKNFDIVDYIDKSENDPGPRSKA